MTNRFRIERDSCYKSRSAMYTLSMFTRCYFRFFLAAALLAAYSFLIPAPASALSVHDWETLKSEHERTAYIGDFVEKFTAEIGKKNPSLCQAIRDWFIVKPAGWSTSQGAEKLEVEMATLDAVAKEGKVDLSKVQIEGVIVKVIKDKFQPQK